MFEPARRVKSAIFGAFIGILMIPGSIALQAWNEYRTIHRTHGLDEAIEIVERIDDIEDPREDLDTKLVHLSGPAVSEQELRDPVFGVSMVGVRLSREVEMYQWHEDRRTDDGKTRYRYSTRWASDRIESSSFRHAGHTNPDMAYRPWSALADRVDVGAYRLSKSLARQKDDRKFMEIDFEELRSRLGKDAKAPLSFGDGYVYCAAGGGNASSPRVGDLRIRFAGIPNGPISLMAQLSGDSFTPYVTSNGEEIDRLYVGNLTAGEVVAKLRFENRVLAWLIRGGGFVLAVVGFLLVFGPAQKLFSWIPLVGDIAGGLIFVAALFLAGATSVATISVAWIAVRPLLGGSLLAVAALLAFLAWKTRSRADHGAGRNPGFQTEAPIELTDDMLVG